MIDHRHLDHEGSDDVASLIDALRTPTQTAALPRLLPTGFDMLDRSLFGGLREGDLTLVGGRPGVGKTVLTLQWARHLARSGHDVLYVCYEHDQRSLLGRLLALEVGEMLTEGADAGEREAATLLREIARGEWNRGSHAADHPLVRAALDRMGEYGGLVQLVAGDREVTIDVIEQRVAKIADNGVLFVDYLQRMPLERDYSIAESSAHVAQRLKSLALDAGIPIVAISKLREGALSAKRLRLGHMSGAETLAYEADLVIMVNEKDVVVSKVHHAYDTTKTKDFEQRVVLSVEKNRSGENGMHIDFEKDFAHFRFVPTGNFTPETLIDDVTSFE